jgi:hypothetical protein
MDEVGFEKRIASYLGIKENLFQNTDFLVSTGIKAHCE